LSFVSFLLVAAGLSRHVLTKMSDQQPIAERRWPIFDREAIVNQQSSIGNPDH
jgi:hypothetical protein